jgi:carbon monoxide dehydrogenase subunit G
MELNNDFRVSVGPPEAWKVLTDVERIAPMLPGAQLQEVEGDDYRGIVKVKVGPISAQYKGTATFIERDETAGRMVLKASGRDTRGQGNANALITVNMTPDGTGTKVSVVTDLTITGKVAQFGRGVLADISGKLITQFVDALEADLESGGAVTDAPPPPAAAETAAEDPAAPLTGVINSSPSVAAPEPVTPVASTDGPRRIDSPEPQPVDLLDAAGGSVAKRLIPVFGVVAALAMLLVLRRRRKSRRLSVASLRASLPDRGDLPSVASLRASLPDRGDLPSVASLRASLPDRGDLPSIEDLVRRLPDRGDLPSVDQLVRHLPDPSTVGQLGRRAAKQAAKASGKLPKRK